MKMQTTPFNNAQLELLKLFNNELKENDLKELKTIIAKFLFEKARGEVAKSWDEKEYDLDSFNKKIGIFDD